MVDGTVHVRADDGQGSVLGASVAVHHKGKHVASGASNEDEGRGPLSTPGRSAENVRYGLSGSSSNASPNSSSATVDESKKP